MQPVHTSARNPLALSAVAFAALLAGTQTHAATCTWTAGGGTNATSNTANWDCAGGPVAGDSLVFPASAANKVVQYDSFITVADASFAPGYAVSGTLWFDNLLDITAPLAASTAIFSGENSGSVSIHGSGLAEINFLANIDLPASIQVDGQALARVAATSSAAPAPISVGAGSRLSAGQGVTGSTLNIASGGTLALSEPPTGAVAGSTVGSLTVTGAATFAAGATLEYLASTTYDSGHLLAQDGLALNGATLRIVLEDPANPDAIGYMRTLAAYGDSSKLTGRFAGLPATGALVQASNAPGIWYSVSYGFNSNSFVQITRVAAPVVPPPGPGGAAPIPVLAPAGLALLSALVGGLGLARRGKKSE